MIVVFLKRNKTPFLFYIKAFKEKQINDYISNNLNFENPNQISSNQVKNDLKNILGEEPGIKLNYRTDTMISETGGKNKRVEILESITIGSPSRFLRFFTNSL